MIKKGRIIMLNGVSSSGKSTVAQAIVKADPSYFHLSIDDYDLFIERAEDRQGGHLIPMETEHFFYKTVAMFSDVGINVVVDGILHDEQTRQSFYEILGAYPLGLVGVHCSPQLLTERENLRGDRPMGLAIRQLGFVHQQENYDVEVDTGEMDAQACAQGILAVIENKSGYENR